MTRAPQVNNLFRTLAAGKSVSEPVRLDDGQIRTALLLGLGPLLRLAADDAEGLLPAPFLLPVACAELAARKASDHQAEALREILDRATSLSDHITLLKGVDARDHYPARYLRRMGDIDLLVEERDVERLEGTLRELGYEPEPLRMPESFYEDHHHSRPFIHPDTDVRVEIHRELAGPNTTLGLVPAFDIAAVRSHRHLSDCDGRPVYRLDRELSLAYTAAHWCYDLRPPLVFNGLVDCMLMLGDGAQEIDWQVICGWLDNQRIATSLYILMTYLEKYDLIEIDASFRPKLLAARKSVGPLGLRMLHSIVDGSLTGRLWARWDLRDAATIVWRAMTCASSPSRNVFRVPYFLLFPQRPTNPESIESRRRGNGSPTS